MDFLSMLRRLTDNYTKAPDSNIGKLFQVVSYGITEVKQAFEKIELWRDLDQAKGITLDEIGRNLDQSRGGLLDAQYKILLKTKIKRNVSRGDINTIIEVFASVLNVSVTEIRVMERYPAGLYIQAPLTPLDEDVFNSATTIGKFVQGTIAGGVGLIVPFEGTFQFAAGPTVETDTNAGFSDSNQTSGGFFGGVYDSEVY